MKDCMYKYCPEFVTFSGTIQKNSTHTKKPTIHIQGKLCVSFKAIITIEGGTLKNI